MSLLATDPAAQKAIRGLHERGYTADEVHRALRALERRAAAAPASRETGIGEATAAPRQLELWPEARA